MNVWVRFLTGGQPVNLTAGVSGALRPGGARDRRARHLARRRRDRVPGRDRSEQPGQPADVLRHSRAARRHAAEVDRSRPERPLVAGRPADRVRPARWGGRRHAGGRGSHRRERTRGAAGGRRAPRSLARLVAGRPVLVLQPRGDVGEPRAVRDPSRLRRRRAPKKSSSPRAGARRSRSRSPAASCTAPTRRASISRSGGSPGTATPCGSRPASASTRRRGSRPMPAGWSPRSISRGARSGRSRSTTRPPGRPC